MGVCPPGAFVDDIDDPRRGLFQGESGGVDDGCAQSPLNGAYLVQFIEDLSQVRVAVVGTEPSQPLHTARPDLQQAFGVYRQTDDAPAVDTEKLFGWSDTGNQRNVDRLVTQISQVDRQRGLAGA